MKAWGLENVCLQVFIRLSENHMTIYDIVTSNFVMSNVSWYSAKMMEKKWDIAILLWHSSVFSDLYSMYLCVCRCSYWCACICNPLLKYSGTLSNKPAILLVLPTEWASIFIEFCHLWYMIKCHWIFIISPVSEGSGDVMVLRRSRPPPATRRPQWC